MFTGAINITSGLMVNGTTVGATAEAGESERHTVWYRFTTPARTWTATVSMGQPQACRRSRSLPVFETCFPDLPTTMNLSVEQVSLCERQFAG